MLTTDYNQSSEFMKQKVGYVVTLILKESIWKIKSHVGYWLGLKKSQFRI